MARRMGSRTAPRRPAPPRHLRRLVWPQLSASRRSPPATIRASRLARCTTTAMECSMPTTSSTNGTNGVHGPNGAQPSGVNGHAVAGPETDAHETDRLDGYNYAFLDELSKKA